MIAADDSYIKKSASRSFSRFQQIAHIGQELDHVLIIMNEEMVAFVMMKETVRSFVRELLPLEQIVFGVSVVFFAEKRMDRNV